MYADLNFFDSNRVFVHTDTYSASWHLTLVNTPVNTRCAAYIKAVECSVPALSYLKFEHLTSMLHLCSRHSYPTCLLIKWTSRKNTASLIIYMLIYHKKAFSIQIDGWTDLKNQRFKRTLLGRSTGAHVPKQLFDIRTHYSPARLEPQTVLKISRQRSAQSNQKQRVIDRQHLSVSERCASKAYRANDEVPARLDRTGLIKSTPRLFNKTPSSGCQYAINLALKIHTGRHKGHKRYDFGRWLKLK
jgi:hypothetical protein